MAANLAERDPSVHGQTSVSPLNKLTNYFLFSKNYIIARSTGLAERLYSNKLIIKALIPEVLTLGHWTFGQYLTQQFNLLQCKTEAELTGFSPVDRRIQSISQDVRAFVYATLLSSKQDANHSM